MTLPGITRPLILILVWNSMLPALTLQRQTSVLTFDTSDLGPFDYDNLQVAAFDCSENSSFKDTGFCHGIVSPPAVAANFDPTQSLTLTYTGRGFFDLNSLYLTAQFFDTNVTVDGYSNGILRYHEVLPATVSGPTLYTLDYMRVDQVVLSPECACAQLGFVIDDLTYTGRD